MSDLIEGCRLGEELTRIVREEHLKRRIDAAARVGGSSEVIDRTGDLSELALLKRDLAREPGKITLDALEPALGLVEPLGGGLGLSLEVLNLEADLLQIARGGLNGLGTRHEHRACHEDADRAFHRSCEDQD